MKRTIVGIALFAVLFCLIAVPGAIAAPARSSLIFGVQSEPPTMDIHVSPTVFDQGQYIGASLITRDPTTGKYLPYLAKSWSVSPDGLTYEFTLRDDVYFHNGQKLTAKDYAWTFNRAISVPVQSTAGATLLNMKEAVAIDQYTFQIKLKMPNSTLFDVLSRPTYHQPLSQAYVESKGDAYGRSPLGVGPYKFKEWVTGSKMVLERNPAFAWGPSFTAGKAPQIETVEFRFIPEYATRLAGLEAGEIDYMQLEAKDVARFKQNPKYQLFTRGDSGSGWVVILNLSKEPFTDIRFRKALNHGVDRNMLVKVAALGQAEVQNGPITKNTQGYWDGVDGIAYAYDVAKAKSYLADMGYKPGADGIMQKDGARLSLVLDIPGGETRTGEILQQQLKAIGIEVKLRQKEVPVLYADLAKGDFQFALNRYGWEDYGLMFAMFHPAMLGNLNHSQQSQDKTLTQILGGAVFGPNDQVTGPLIIQVQKYLVEQAYSVPLYTHLFTYALNKRVKGVVYHRISPLIFDASIQY
ncbi:MAG: ABC transporter substrate-binding protein [Rectinemataceae bacterium]